MQLGDFEGRWRMSRVVHHHGGPDARFDGVAAFVRDAGGLVLTEEGELRLPGQVPMRATRRYLWRQEGAHIAVFFDDGRAFHHIGGERSGAEAEHHCDPDLYRVRYDFGDWPLWRAEWRVTGPRKDSRMVTEYRRI